MLAGVGSFISKLRGEVVEHQRLTGLRLALDDGWSLLLNMLSGRELALEKRRFGISAMFGCIRY